MPLFVWFSAVLIILFFLNDRVKNKRLYQLAERFPGPSAIPLIGNSKDFIFTESHAIFSKVLGFKEKYGRFFRLWNGGKFYLFISDYKDAKVILESTNHIKKSESYKFIHPWIGENILTGSGPLWKNHRKIITSAFHFNILLNFVDIFNKNALIFCEKLAQQEKGVFDIYKNVKLLALDNIYETAMGISMEVQKNSETEYVQAVKDMCFVANQRFYKVWLMIDLFFHLSEYSQIQKNALSVLHRTTEEIIKFKIKENRKEIKKFGNEDRENKKMAFLDLLLHSPEAADWTEKEFRQEVDTILFAGHDTVSSGLGFAFYCLAHNPDVQENVYKEQLKIFGDSDRLPTSEDIQEMKYLERFIKEVQRLYPSAPIVARDIKEELVLPGEVTIPQGTQLNIMIYSIHRDPRVWNNPNEFNPDNFLPEAILSRPAYTYIPFSAGPRNCLGQKYAMLEMKSTIGIAVRKYKFWPSSAEEHKIRLAAEIILVSKNGIHVRVEPRSSTH